MDYIKPAQCTETQFRTMWTEFEWENKVNINSKAKTLREFLKQLMACTNMSCLTPEASMKGDCQFLSANLYARSVFGKTLQSSLTVRYADYSRRGRSGQPEYREGGREWPNYRFCPYSQSIARISIELGVAEGAEQGWCCVINMLIWYDYDNAVCRQKYEHRRVELSSNAQSDVGPCSQRHPFTTRFSILANPNSYLNARADHVCALVAISWSG